jgi:hypothetical protein
MAIAMPRFSAPSTSRLTRLASQIKRYASAWAERGLPSRWSAFAAESNAAASPLRPEEEPIRFGPLGSRQRVSGGRNLVGEPRAISDTADDLGSLADPREAFVRQFALILLAGGTRPLPFGEVADEEDAAEHGDGCVRQHEGREEGSDYCPHNHGEDAVPD